MIKKNVLLVSAVYIAYFFGILLVSSLCDSAWCKIRDNDPFGLALFVFMSLTLVFLFSLITYRMKEEVFSAWWNFARWFVPIIILVTFLQNTAHQQSGLGGVAQGSFDLFVLMVLYIVFILVSSIKIIRAYKRTK